VPRLEGDGTFAGLVGSCVDVTDTRRAREVLEQTRDQLAELVAQRTAELEKSNAKLRAEIRYRVRIEEEIARVRRLADVRAQGEGAPRRRQARRGTGTVLLVEGQEDVRQLLKSVLELHGYRVLEAVDADAALLLAAQETAPIDLLLVDVAAPDAGGPALMRRLVTGPAADTSLLMS